MTQLRQRGTGATAAKHEIAAAPDDRIVRIVATVDAMAARGPADDLLAPLRPRLSVLRPPRPLRFTRLLFHALDPLIVPASRWRPGQPAIPRTALAPMAAHVRARMADAARIEAAIAGRFDNESDPIADLGKTLWPEAAGILASPDIPAAWAETGISVDILILLASSRSNSR